MANEAKPVEYRNLGSTGLKVSVPIVGSVQKAAIKQAIWVNKTQ